MAVTIIMDKFKHESTHPIEELYAYISRELDGSESIMCLMGPNGAFPLVGSDMKRMQSLRPMVETTADRYGKHVILAKFSNRKDMTLGHLRGLPLGRGRWE